MESGVSTLMAEYLTVPCECFYFLLMQKAYSKQLRGVGKPGATDG